MPRSIHNDLLAKQSTNIQPAIQAVFTHRTGSPTYDYSFDPTVTTNRLQLVEHHEEPYDDYAKIMLRNNDLAVPDLTGYYVDLGYGANTASGLRYSPTPRLWVKAQISLSGAVKGKKPELKSILLLDGVWRLLKEQQVMIGNPPFFQDENHVLTGLNIYSILNYLIQTAFSAATGYTFYLDALGTQDDGIILSFIPVLDINPKGLETFAYLIHTVMRMTKCYLRPEPSLAFKVIFPQSSDAVDEEYFSGQVHYFYENADQLQLTLPNRVTVYANQAGGWSISENAYNADDYLNPPNFSGSYMPVIKSYYEPDVTTSIDARNRAEALQTKAQAEVFGGRVVIPHDSRVELYDRVRIYDTRGV